MYSTLNRAQAVFGFFTTVAMVVAVFAALSVTLYPTDDATAKVQVRDVKVIKGRPHYYSSKKEEYAQIRFDLDADLTPLFNWNTKQLFVYVYATYSSSSDPTSSAPPTDSIIWDTIIEAPESPYSFANMRERFFRPKSPSGSSSSRRRSVNSASKNGKDKNKGKKGRNEPGVLRLRDQKSKYQISDITGWMAERENVTLAVGWNVQPWVGALWWAPGTGAGIRTKGVTGRTKGFDLPMLKGSRPKEGEQQRASSV